MSFEFGTWEAPSTVNPYVDVITALAALNDESKSWQVIVHKSDLLKTRNHISKAANAVNKTARMRVNGETVIEDGVATDSVRFVITLVPMHKPRKGDKRDKVAEGTPNQTDAVDAQTSTEAPTSAPKPPTSAPKPGK
jgi:hypothetical protein